MELDLDITHMNIGKIPNWHPSASMQLYGSGTAFRCTVSTQWFRWKTRAGAPCATGCGVLRAGGRATPSVEPPGGGSEVARVFVAGHDRPGDSFGCRAKQQGAGRVSRACRVRFPMEILFVE